MIHEVQYPACTPTVFAGYERTGFTSTVVGVDVAGGAISLSAGALARIVCKDSAVFGFDMRSRFSLFFAVFLYDMQIERDIDAVAQIGKEMLQHIIIRFTFLQIHQLLFTAVDDVSLVIVNLAEYGRECPILRYVLPCRMLRLAPVACCMRHPSA